MIAVLFDLLEEKEDKEKFECLYEKYNKLVYWITFGKLNNKELSEECVQETFLYLAKKFEKVESVDSSRTKGYVATVVGGMAIKIYNKEHRGVFESIDDLPVSANNFEYLIRGLKEFDSLEIKFAIETLDDECKNFLYLKYVYGFSVSRISEMYNTSDYYVNKSLNKALKKLKSFLDEQEESLIK
ncbi:MAG: sigma-70 family RNA polymerase sigma factor [Clostridiales bacterium]|nr:sigma-70 family RNA polymerase sigma factor [Clostridiales bacterium]